jgi:hypothetical protein
LLFRRTVVTDLVQGIIAGGVVAFFTAILIVNAEDSRLHTTVNGWSTTLKCGERRNGIFLRAACANHVAAALNLPVLQRGKDGCSRAWPRDQGRRDSSQYTLRDAAARFALRLEICLGPDG